MLKRGVYILTVKEKDGDNDKGSLNTYQVIDEKNWERAMHCMVFRESVEPAFCVTFEADITNFRRKVKAQNLSFTLAFVYAVCKCADEIEAFRYRFLEGKVVLFEHIDTAFTYLNQDTGLFKVVNVPLRGSIQEYVETAGRIAREQKEYFTGPLGNFRRHKFFTAPFYTISDASMARTWNGLSHSGFLY